MLRRHWVLALLLPCTTCATSDSDLGTGRVILSPRVQASFEEYMARDAPLYFLVTESGVGSYYIYCEGGFNCTRSAARMQALDQCRRHNAGEDCKVYAIRRSVVWQNADAPRPAPQLSAVAWLVRECLEGATPKIRIDRCSKAVASPELEQSQKRGPLYVRARAYEQIGRISEAERDYRAVLRVDPDHPGAKARLQDLHAPVALPVPPRPNSA
jgi:hypothetical protein